MINRMVWLLKQRRLNGPETVALLCGDDADGRFDLLPPATGLDYPTLKMVGPVLKEHKALIGDVLRAPRGLLIGQPEATRALACAREHGDGNTIDRLSRMPGKVLPGIHARLVEITRRYDAVNLAATHFPGLLKKHQADDGWAPILLDVLKYFQRAKWLPLDDYLIGCACDLYDGEEDVSLLESFLTCIPVEPLFVNGWEVHESYTPIDPHPVDLLYGLFVDESLLGGQGAARKWGLTDSEMDPEVNAGNIRQAPPGTFKPGTPLAYLPEVVSLYRQETGFRLIDRPVATEMYYDEGAQDFPWTELKELRGEWNGGVKELVAHRRALEAWLEDDGNARQLVTLVLELNKEYGGAK